MVQLTEVSLRAFFLTRVTSQWQKMAIFLAQWQVEALTGFSAPLLEPALKTNL